jgi:hypothetical protein
VVQVVKHPTHDDSSQHTIIVDEEQGAADISSYGMGVVGFQ